MDRYTVWILLALVVAATAGFSFAAWRERRKRRRAIHTGFGQPPAPVGRLAGSLYWQALCGQKMPENAVDDITWKDLDMDEVFLALNACQCGVGDVTLYSLLRQPLAARAQTAQREALMAAFEQDPKLRERVQYKLAAIGRKAAAGAENAAFHAAGLRERNAWRFYVLGALPLVALGLVALSPQVGLAALACACLGNFVYYHTLRSKRDAAVGTVGYLVALLVLSGHLAGQLKAVPGGVSRRLEEATKPFRFLHRSYLLIQIDSVLAATGLPNPMAFFQLPMISYCKIGRRLAGMETETQALFAAVGAVDVAAALLSYRHCLPLWCAPVYREKMGVEAKNLYHPLLEEPVANDVNMRGDTLFTGSNASGKSTFIKAVAVNQILAQALNTCTAEAFALRAGPVVSSMAVTDSVVEGDSYFVAEIKSMRRLVQVADTGAAATLFIDEILRGTNTTERVAAATALLRYLHGTNCQCFAATHDRELTALLAGSFANYHFRESIQDGQVVFDYRLRSGPARTRNAIALLGSLGFPAEVTEAAGELAARFEQTGEWPQPTE